MVKIFHVRAPKPRAGVANQFYGPDGYRANKTLCGAPITDQDIRYGWEAFAGGPYVCCEQCLAVRETRQREARRKRG